MNKMSISAKFLEFAGAYLQSASMVNDLMAGNPDRTSDAMGSVVMFNARLAVELFLKGMIVAKRPDTKLHHGLEKLESTYKELYPGKEFSWNVPFTVQVIGGKASEQRDIALRAAKERPLDQVFRYPVSSIGEPWQIVENYSPRDLASLLGQIGMDFVRIKELLERSGGAEA